MTTPAVENILEQADPPPPQTIEGQRQQQLDAIRHTRNQLAKTLQLRCRVTPVAVTA